MEKNLGVEVIMKRMETHPEEFQWGVGGGLACKWHWFVDALLRTVFYPSQSVPIDSQLFFIPKEDIDLLYAKLCTIQGEAFSRRVVSQIFSIDGDARDRTG